MGLLIIHKWADRLTTIRSWSVDTVRLPVWVNAAGTIP